MEEVTKRVSDLNISERRSERSPMKPGLVYDARMRDHVNEANPGHPEQPDRISRIWDLLSNRGLVARCTQLEARRATRAEIMKIHSEEYYSLIEQSQNMTSEQLMDMARDFKDDSVYLHQMTFSCALLAAGSVVDMTERVLQGQLPSGVAVVRPPGHHAVTNQCMGFCIFNSVAIAAKVAIDNYDLSRILIVDWDVHHGNATQEQFYNDKRVLYFSLHRYDNGKFYPSTTDAGPTHVGGASAEGYSVNMAWSGSKMGDAEYMAALQHLLLPIAYEFDPELVLVSCGLDAANGDPLGGYHVTPECYGHMTHLLCGLAGGKMVIALEGGYNLTAISESMAACVGVLVGDPLPQLNDVMVPNDDAVRCIRDTVTAHIPYWKSLRLFDRSCSHSGSDGLGTTSPGQDKCSLQSNNLDSQDTPGARDESHDQSHDRSHDQSHDQEGGAVGGSDAGPDKLLDTLRELSVGEEVMFAVSPLSYCDHLSSLSPHPLPPDITSHRCEECNEEREPWVCLQCHHVYCGRYVNGHMVSHNEGCGHPLAISLADISVWCFPCDAYLDHASLVAAKNTIHRGKFGCNMDGTTTD